MSKPKKLDLSIEELRKIAMELNNNTLANKSRSKEEKIVTDKFIRKFDITRKDFAETIKGTGITYNRSTFLYDIDVNYCKEIEDDTEHVVTEENIPAVEVKQKMVKEDKRITKKSISDTGKAIDIIKILEEQLPEVLDIVKEYKLNINKNTNISKAITINLPKDKLTGEDMTRSFKTYKSVLDDFKLFCNGRNESQKDLLAMALIEFMDKYKKDADV